MSQNEKVNRLLDIVGDDLADLHLDGQLEFVQETLKITSESIARVAQNARSISVSNGNLMNSLTADGS